MKNLADKTQTVNLYDINFSNLTKREFLTDLLEFTKTGKRGFVVTPNVDHVIRFQKDALFKKAYKNARFVLTDGMPLVFTSKLFGRPLKEKISGSDIFTDIIRLAAANDLRIFLLGASADTNLRGTEKLRREYPQLKIAGRCSPPWGFEKDPVQNEKILSEIREARPDLLFIFLGSPKQEMWIDQNIAALKPHLAFCFGAALDFYAGKIKRSPVWMQRAGLEWFWRLLTEPRRLGKRYLIDNLFPFLKIFLREFRKTESSKRADLLE